VKLLERMYHGTPTDPEEEVVVLGQVLACDATLGYEDIYNVQVSGAGCSSVLARWMAVLCSITALRRYGVWRP